MGTRMAVAAGPRRWFLRDLAPRTLRVERGCLPDHGAGGIARHFELDPGLTREFHFRGQPQTAIRFDRLHAPEVDGVGNAQGIQIAAPPPKPHPAEQPVKQPADLPQPVRVIPALSAADPANRRESNFRRSGHVDRPGIDQEMPNIRLEGFRDRLTKSAGPDFI